MVHTIILESERLLMRPIRMSDSYAMFSYTSDIRVAHYTNWIAHQTISETVDYISYINLHPLIMSWVITQKKTNLPLGECSLSIKNNHTVEISYALAYQYWNHGYMSEALSLLIPYAQRLHHISHVEAWILGHNHASIALARKMGFSLEHTFEQKWHLNDTIYDIHLFSTSPHP